MTKEEIYCIEVQTKNIIYNLGQIAEQEVPLNGLNYNETLKAQQQHEKQINDVRENLYNILKVLKDVEPTHNKEKILYKELRLRNDINISDMYLPNEEYQNYELATNDKAIEY